jgi:hypothetical protein
VLVGSPVLAYIAKRAELTRTKAIRESLTTRLAISLLEAERHLQALLGGASDDVLQRLPLPLDQLVRLVAERCVERGRELSAYKSWMLSTTLPAGFAVRLATDAVPAPSERNVIDALLRIATDPGHELDIVEAGVRASSEAYLPELLRWPSDRQAEIAVLALNLNELSRSLPAVQHVRESAGSLRAQLNDRDATAPPALGQDDPSVDTLTFWLTQVEAILGSSASLLEMLAEQI